MAKRMFSTSEKSDTGLVSEDSSIRDLDVAKQVGSWRVTVRAGAGIASVVFCINLGVLIWASTMDVKDGSATVFEEMKRITFWADLAINILSTLLLGASNNCTQLLAAPTRKDIDDAHAAGRWLDVGVSSMRNILAVSGWRKCLCACLFLSSIPLHLLYNSVIFSTLSASNYMAAIVTDDFFTGAAWNETRLQRVFEDSERADRLLTDPRDNVDNLTRLENEDCIRQYGLNSLQSSWKNVLLVSIANVTGPLIRPYFHHAEEKWDDLGWICGNQSTGVGYQDNGHNCNTAALLSHSTDWVIKDYLIEQQKITFKDGSVGYMGSDAGGPPYEASIKYCLAEPTEQHCTVQISTPLLGIVLLCNLVKVLCLAGILFVRGFYPLATVGDLISSCLSDPDSHTHGKGPLAAKDIPRHDSASYGKWLPKLVEGYRQIHVERSMSLLSRSHNQAMPAEESPATTEAFEKSNVAPIKWKKRVYRWHQASSTLSWVVCMTLSVLTWLTGLCLLVSSVKRYKRLYDQTYTLSSMWSSGVGNISTNNLIGSTGNGRSLLANVLLANTPQIIISFIYLFYNNCLTRMLLGQEYTDYARHRKPLRVSRPKGEQRSTYRLQLPYRYSVPLMTAMAVLHWLVARSIFLVEVNPYDYDGVVLIDKISACGYSTMAIVLSLMVSGVIILALLAVGARRLEPDMPLASSCSLAIAAACHTLWREEDAELLPLKYGVVIREDSNCEDGWEHACFSSKEVTPLVDGRLYI
ncbi:hypothetical protein D6D18_03211 [Aureobasidium pullulans]|nr:hypothetical protein D6D18_03211 [Aureobasidium pullulans]